MKLFLLVLLLCPTLVFCEAKYIGLSDDIVSRHVNFVCNKYDLEALSSGGGMMFDVDLLINSFVSRQRPNLDEARRLFVHCSQDLLGRINNDKAIRPYLCQFPFKIENLQYSLSFQGSQPCLDPYIIGVYAHRSNWVCYWMQDGGPIGRIVHEESYDDAVRIVEEEERNRPKVILQQAPKPTSRRSVSNRYRCGM